MDEGEDEDEGEDGEVEGPARSAAITLRAFSLACFPLALTLPCPLHAARVLLRATQPEARAEPFPKTCEPECPI